MTTPTPAQLHHLANRARDGVALPAEHDQLANGITAMAVRAERAEAAIERVRKLHHETCLVASGPLRNSFSCGICEALDKQQPTTTEAGPAVTVHACPGPDDNGISPCCKRPPFEFRSERLTRDPAAVTCPGPAQQPTV